MSAMLRSMQLCTSRPLYRLSSVRPIALPPILPFYASVSRRPYALSRFPGQHRAPGAGRVRDPPSAQKSLPGADDAKNSSAWEDQPSINESKLWESSQHRVGSDPEEGLKRLLFGSNTLVITRQIEMLNIFIGFEQTNKYQISNEAGEPLGFIAEEPRGFLAQFGRQIFRTHRPFRAIIMDNEGTPILWIRRPFDWINSRMFVSHLKDFNQYTEDGQPVLDTFAEAQQRWHFWRRRYDLFLRDTPRRVLSTVDEPQPEPDLHEEQYTQLAKIDEGLWAWDFAVRDEKGGEIASISRQFRGFGREIFTDTGQYYITFGPRMPTVDEHGMLHPPVITRHLDIRERALILAMAVNVDFDYFSRHSEGGGAGGLGFWHIFGGGDWE